MDWSDWIALGALAVSVAALVWSRLDVGRARQDADRASAEAAEARDLLRRATEAQEQNAAAAERANERAEAPDLQVRFRRNSSSDGFSVINEGRGVAHEVWFEIDGDHTLPNPVDLQGGEETDPIWLSRRMTYRPPDALLVTCAEWSRPRALAVPPPEA